MMDRRAFVGMIAGGVLAVRQTARSQPAPKSIGSESSVLRRPPIWLGHSPGLLPPARSCADCASSVTLREHFVTEPRGGEGKPERFPGLAAELVGLQVDVIVAAGPSAGRAQAGDLDDPHRHGGHDDPVGQGYVQSLGRPGGNITGLSFQSVEVTGKRLELLSVSSCQVGHQWG